MSTQPELTSYLETEEPERARILALIKSHYPKIQRQTNNGEKPAIDLSLDQLNILKVAAEEEIPIYLIAFQKNLTAAVEFGNDAQRVLTIKTEPTLGECKTTATRVDLPDLNQPVNYNDVNFKKANRPIFGEVAERVGFWHPLDVIREVKEGEVDGSKRYDYYGQPECLGIFVGCHGVAEDDSSCYGFICTTS